MFCSKLFIFVPSGNALFSKLLSIRVEFLSCDFAGTLRVRKRYSSHNSPASMRVSEHSCGCLANGGVTKWGFNAYVSSAALAPEISRNRPQSANFFCLSFALFRRAWRAPGQNPRKREPEKGQEFLRLSSDFLVKMTPISKKNTHTHTWCGVFSRVNVLSSFSSLPFLALVFHPSLCFLTFWSLNYPRPSNEVLGKNKYTTTDLWCVHPFSLFSHRIEVFTIAFSSAQNVPPWWG